MSDLFPLAQCPLCPTMLSKGYNIILFYHRVIFHGIYVPHPLNSIMFRRTVGSCVLIHSATLCLLIREFKVIIDRYVDADPGLREWCVVAPMGKFHTDYRNPAEKRGWHGHSLNERGWEGQREPDPCLDRLLLLLWVHYMEDGPHLLGTGLL